eukprot:31079-Eustigmatos_ZCMA.PRE.1
MARAHRLRGIYRRFGVGVQALRGLIDAPQPGEQQGSQGYEATSQPEADVIMAGRLRQHAGECRRDNLRGAVGQGHLPH